MIADRREPAPVESVVIGRPWNSGQRISVLSAVDRDYKAIEMNGRDDLRCPVCENDTLKYRRTGYFAMTAWCDHCNAGMKQGDGAR